MRLLTEVISLPSYVSLFVFDSNLKEKTSCILPKVKKIRLFMSTKYYSLRNKTINQIKDNLLNTEEILHHEVQW